ncbi:MAG TPA: efflux RND transporter periplasmic adaptor subunit [Pirellulales bacterium]|nr:efflux RND transporter periplasmic adaptor subunit [Pirellulales bacterium]
MINRPASRVETPAAPKAAAAPDTLADRVRSLRLPGDREYERAPWRRWMALALIGLSAVGGGAAFVLLPDRDAKPAIDRTDAATEPSADASPESPNPDNHGPTVRAAATTASSATTSRTPAAGEVVLESKGYIIPAHQILVSPKVSGMIVELHLEEGRRVHKGDVLAVLETTDYDADFARAEAMLAMSKQKLAELEHGNRPEEIAAAQAELAEAQAQREQLQNAWRRNQPLKGTKVLSDTDYEQSESQFKAMDRRVARLNSNYKLMVAGPRQERIELARAEVRQAEAELAKVQWRLDNCTIRAPISGTILKKNAEEGNIVNPVAFNGSYSVCDLADLSDLEVDLSIQERDIARVRVGQLCQVRPEAFSDRVYPGVVSRLMPIADRAKGAVPVRVKLRVPADEEGVYLKPEMSAVVSFLNSTAKAE